MTVPSISRTAWSDRPTTYKLRFRDVAGAYAALPGRAFRLALTRGSATLYSFSATIAEETIGGVTASTATMTVSPTANTALLVGEGLAADVGLWIGELVDGVDTPVLLGVHQVRVAPVLEDGEEDEGGEEGPAAVYTLVGDGAVYVVTQAGAPGRSAAQALYDAGTIEAPTAEAMDARYRSAAAPLPASDWEGAAIDPSVDALVTSGYAAAGDGGAAMYAVAEEEPAHEGKFQDADGRWFSIVQPELSPFQFGATGGDPDADTLAWNRANAAAVELGRPIVTGGTFRLKVQPTTLGQFMGRDFDPIRVAVELTQGVSVHDRGSGCTLIPYKPDFPIWEPHVTAGNAPVGYRMSLFGTADIVARRTFGHTAFRGIKFLWDQDAGEWGAVLRGVGEDEHAVSAMIGGYALGVCGFDGFDTERCEFEFAGDTGDSGVLQGMRGRAIWAHNLERLKFLRNRHLGTTQAAYLAYIWDIFGEGNSHEGLVECYDHDLPCWDVTYLASTFKNLINEAQCFDSAGGSNWLIDGVKAANVSEVVTLYTKYSSRPTFELHIEAVQSGDPNTYPGEIVPLENVTVSNVHVNGFAGSNARLARVGVPRDADEPRAGLPVVKGVAFDKWVVKDHHFIWVCGCDGFTFTNFLLENIDAQDNENRGAAIVLEQAGTEATNPEIHNVADDVLNATIRNGVIRNAKRDGLRASRPRNLTIDNVLVDGFGKGDGVTQSRPFLLNGLGVKPGTIRLGQMAERNGTAAVNSLGLAGSASYSEDYKVYADGPFTFDSTTSSDPVLLNGGDIYKHIVAATPVPVPTLSSAGSGIHYGVAMPAEYMLVADVRLSLQEPITAPSIDNYTRIRLDRRGAGADTSLGNGIVSVDNMVRDRGALIEVNQSAAIYSSNNTFAPGEQLALKATKTGTGSTLPALFAHVAAIRWQKTALPG